MSECKGRAGSCLLVLCGLPGAGKSSLAQRLCDQLEQASISNNAIKVHTTVVSFDEHSSVSTTAQFSPDDWRIGRQRALLQLETLLSLPISQQGAHLVIADDTMHYKSMRHECYKLARECKAAYVQVYLSCPLATAIAQNAQRPLDARIPDAVIRKTAEMFEDPTQSPLRCDQDCSMTVPVDESHIDPGEVWKGVWNLWGPAVPAPPEELVIAQRLASQRANLESVVHQADVSSRKVVAEALTLAHSLHVGGPVKAELARDLTELRRGMLLGGALHRKTAEEIEALVTEFTHQSQIYVDKICKRA